MTIVNGCLTCRDYETNRHLLHEVMNSKVPVSESKEIDLKQLLTNILIEEL